MKQHGIDIQPNAVRGKVPEKRKIKEKDERK